MVTHNLEYQILLKHNYAVIHIKLPKDLLSLKPKVKLTKQSLEECLNITIQSLKNSDFNYSDQQINTQNQS